MHNDGDPRLPVSEVRTLDDVVRNAIAAPRFAMQLLKIFGVMALAQPGGVLRSD
ncbi:MAG: hypothetical protein IT360_00985 [Gemmatimonadaceae bacterium]|nr:hypothetical protein [Gemmatimonadaceae bacterium]